MYLWYNLRENTTYLMRTSAPKITTPSLVVPFHLSGLYCSSSKSILKSNADFSKVAYYDKDKQRVINSNMPYISENLVSQPFENDSFSLSKGLYLHFILPDFLRSSIPFEYEEKFYFDFPAIPNRWLIIKNKTQEDEKKFIVESDYLFPEYQPVENKVSIPIPTQICKRKKLHIPFRFMGRQIESDDLSRSKGEYWSDIMDTPLTAKGYGDISFTSFVPNCKDILTFHDPDVKDGDSYDVFGYYELDNSAERIEGYLDFICNGGKEFQMTTQEKLKKYWHLNLEEQFCKNLHSVKQIVLCSRFLVKHTKRLLPRKKKIQPSIAIGNSGTEAISSYFEHTLNIKDLETKLEAIQYENIQGGTVDLGAKFLEARHQGGFIPQEGGHSYEVDFDVIPRSKDESQINNAIKKLTDDPILKEKINFTKRAINQLNELQLVYDKKRYKINSKQKQLFADWYKYMLCSHPPYRKDMDYPKADKVMQFLLRNIKDDLAVISQETGLLTIDAQTSVPQLISDKKINSIAKQVVEKFKICHDTLSEVNSKLKKMTEEKLKQLKQHISDIKKLEIQLEKQKTPEQELELFKLKQSLKELTIFTALKDKTITYRIIAKPSDRFFQPVEPVLMMAQPKNQKTQSVFDEVDIPAIVLPMKNPTFKIEEKLYEHTNFIKLLEATQDINDKPYKSEWLLLDWMLDFFPNSDPSVQPDGYEKDFIFKLFDLQEDTPDYAPIKNKNIKLSDIARRYSGRTILSTGSPKFLKEKISNYLEHQEKKNPDLQKVLAQIEKQHIVTQSLGGLNHAFLMCKQTMQLEVTDPIAFDAYKPLIETIKKWVGGQYGSAPEPNHFFNPIRAGIMVIKQLNFIDTFGLTSNIYNSDITPKKPIYKSQSLKLPTKVNVSARFGFQKDEMIHLPPRFPQACRLNLEWIRANEMEEDDFDPNPICGWIMPNFLENTLQVFDQKGEFLGFIGKDGTDIRLYPAPGTNEFLISEIKNEHLKNFVCYFHQENQTEILEAEKVLIAEMFTTLLLEIEQALDFVEPQSYSPKNQLSIFAGRPLAIVRAKLNLEIKGDYAVNQDWNHFKNDIYRDVKTLKRSTYHFENVEIPIRIGDFYQLNDGVIGFWYRNLQKGVLESSDDLTEYKNFNPYSINRADTFYMPLNDKRIRKKRIKKESTFDNNSFLIGQRLNEDPQVISMLFDPRGSLNVACGLLPVKHLELPRAYYKEALEKMRIYFQLAPVLTPFNDLQLPLPNLVSQDWKWVSINRTRTKIEIPASPTINKSIFDKVFIGKMEKSNHDLWKILTNLEWIKPKEEEPDKSLLLDRLKEKKLPNPYGYFEDEIIKLLIPDAENILDQLTIEMAYHQLIVQKYETVWEYLIMKKRIIPIDENRAFINYNTNEHEPLPDFIPSKTINNIFNAHQDGISKSMVDPQYQQVAIREGWVKFA